MKKPVRKFTDEQVVPIAQELDRENEQIPMDVIKQMADLGYFGLIFPPEYDGLGLDYISMAIVAEELSRGRLSVGSVMTRNIITGNLLLSHGTDEQKG